jgi:hypothetical protein
VSSDRQALFEQAPAPDDDAGQQRIALAYTNLKRLSVQYGVQPPSPLPIARDAFDHRMFLLAIGAYADAFTHGDSSPADHEAVRADYAAQYALGVIWAQRTAVSQHTEGMARLVTACQIDERDNLGSPEACNKLRAQLGPITNWPAPEYDPLLDLKPQP